MVYRLNYRVVGLAIVFLLCWMGYLPLACRGAVVWSDDFNDGNYDGWTICSPSWGNPPSKWSAADYYLQIEQEAWGTISHPSTVAYGTWSFDFKANLTQVTAGQGLSINFISNDLNNATEVPTSNDWSCYGFKILAAATTQGNEFFLSLAKLVGGVFTVLDSSDGYLPIVGWQHIDVSRTTGGLFHVYVNNSLILQATDTDMTTSELFVVNLADWNMIDNVVVDDAPPIEWPTIVIIVASAVVIVVVLVIILKRR